MVNSTSISCCWSIVKSCPTPCNPNELQHTRLPCPSPTPGACSNSCPLSHWCHPAISSSDTSFFSCTQSFPVSRSFPMSQLFASGGQRTGALASASVLPMNIQGWFPLGLTLWSPCCPRDSLEVYRLQHHSSKASILQCSAFLLFFLVYYHFSNWYGISLSYCSCCIPSP